MKETNPMEAIKVESIFHPSDFSEASEAAFAHALKMALVSKAMLRRFDLEERFEEAIRATNSGARSAIRTWMRRRCRPRIAALVERMMFFKRLPDVTCVVFICTPHRDSILAMSFVRNLVARFMSFPNKLVRSTEEFLQLREKTHLPADVRHGVPSSLDSMSPSNKVMLSLAKIPPASNNVVGRWELQIGIGIINRLIEMKN